MPYPAKTNREAILLAAVRDLAHGGIRDLSLRNLAASLDLAPTAIYLGFAAWDGEVGSRSGLR